MMIGRHAQQGMKLVLALLAALMLGGCWDKVDLQDIGYLTAIGVDYKDEKFILYGEMVGFSTVAKTEGGGQFSGPLKWIGHSTGDTVLYAFEELAKSSQYQLSLDNLKSLVIHERAMVKMDEILDAMNRQRASRYTVWLFGTRDDLHDFFATDAIFSHSPLVSIMYTPDLMHQQASMHRPLTMQLFLQDLDERAYTTELTNLSSERGKWAADKKALNLNVARGCFLFVNRKKVGYLTEEEMVGLRWVQPDFKKELLSLRVNNKPVTVGVDRVSSRLTSRLQSNSTSFKLRVKLFIHAVELEGQQNDKDIEQSVSDKVKDEIKRTYEAGLLQRADVYQTKLNLYRYHTAFWKKHASSNEWLPGKGDLSIEVTTKLVNTGKYKLK
ncbi:Ger(x)C family germination protein [Paenibacillus cellulosilyticus]|uniref:Ger(X)C family germination protein n=1 Tax=Paenibacillus cellulosilyticus TaxID=375489 RepID=A0A2V2YQT6_9BACL|nr:Ger(x)C family spore germination protein [Paenibacillus cellulosilyticus]PWV95546.1 Ger(x)C family germination protein [Paenibacillus cellulosilyticus]QKS47374.1 Ger(x)C family spore germination protein [Paenibacillus cellulosilyticus]